MALATFFVKEVTGGTIEVSYTDAVLKWQIALSSLVDTSVAIPFLAS